MTEAKKKNELIRVERLFHPTLFVMNIRSERAFMPHGLELMV